MNLKTMFALEKRGLHPNSGLDCGLRIQASTLIQALTQAIFQAIFQAIIQATTHAMTLTLIQERKDLVPAMVLRRQTGD